MGAASRCGLDAASLSRPERSNSTKEVVHSCNFEEFPALRLRRPPPPLYRRRGPARRPPETKKIVAGHLDTGRTDPVLASAHNAPDAAVVRAFSRSAFALLLLPLLFAGCASPEVKRLITITGGKAVPFSFGPKGAEPGRANGYEVQLATLLPAHDAKEIFYQFAFTAPAGAAVKRVQVEDVSEEAAAFPLIDDQAPKLTGNRWQADSATVRAGEAHLTWVLTIQATMRVYRFTITDTAGKRTEMLHVAGYPDFMKTVIRQKWGEKY